MVVSCTSWPIASAASAAASPCGEAAAPVSAAGARPNDQSPLRLAVRRLHTPPAPVAERVAGFPARCRPARSEEHTSELQSLMRISYAVFCLKKKKKQRHTDKQH